MVFKNYNNVEILFKSKRKYFRKKKLFLMSPDFQGSS